jgi:hypothetical protein
MPRQDPISLHRDENNQPVPGFNFQAWLDKHMAFALEATPGWVSAVKEKYGNAKTKYACTGYCFGAPFVCNSLGDGTVDVGAFGHPAFLEEHHFTNLKGKLCGSPGEC